MYAEKAIKVICCFFLFVLRKISHLESGKSERELLRGIEDEAFSLLSELGAPPPRRIHDGSLRSILSQLESLKNTVNNCLDTRLDFYIEVSSIMVMPH